jgi:hypothetical protein
MTDQATDLQRKESPMRIKLLTLTCALCLLAPFAANASTLEYSYAQIFSANSTVDLVATTSGSGNLNGIKCIFPSSDGGAEVKITATLDGTASSFTIDPSNLERESNGGGQYLTGWIPIGDGFSTSIHVTLNNTSLGTATINCWASWFLN